MIAPEIWDFPAPPCSLLFEQGDLTNHDSSVVASCFRNHYYNHMVSMVLPDTVLVPREIQDSLTEDCDYYKFTELPVSALIQKAFIDSFVMKGQITALSYDTKLDTDDSFCLTPTGILILALNKVTYEELGLEGEPSFFCRRKPATRYIVKIDLKAESFTPEKKNCRHVHWCLTKRLNLKFNTLVSWDPPDKRTCPSSVAAYLSGEGYKVQICRPQLNQKLKMDVKVPKLHEYDPDDLLEWLGAVSINADLESVFPENSLSTYEAPIEEEDAPMPIQVAHLQWSGLFTVTQVLRLLEKMKSYVESRINLPWASLHIQGFDDSPVSWGLQEHHFTQIGDNSFTLFLQPNMKFLLCRVQGPRRKPKIKSRFSN